jgi:hypothetical protein
MPKKTKKWTKFLYLPDPHGFAVDPGAWKVAMKFKLDYQPDRVVIGGDFMDLRALRKGACDDDLTEQVRPDFDKGIELLNESEATDVILGNHDDRLWQVANSSGVASEFCKYLVEKLEWWARDRGIDLVPYRADSYLELGPQLKALHGNCANVHSAMKMAQVYGCCVFGHVHRIQYFRANAIDRREAWACGCLCDIFQGYNKSRQATLSQEHGFAYGEYCDTTFDVQIAQKRNGTWRIGEKTYG